MRGHGSIRRRVRRHAFREKGRQTVAGACIYGCRVRVRPHKTDIRDSDLFAEHERVRTHRRGRSVADVPVVCDRNGVRRDRVFQKA